MPCSLMNRVLYLHSTPYSVKCLAGEKQLLLIDFQKGLLKCDATNDQFSEHLILIAAINKFQLDLKNFDGDIGN